MQGLLLTQNTRYNLIQKSTGDSLTKRERLRTYPASWPTKTKLYHLKQTSHHIINAFGDHFAKLFNSDDINHLCNGTCSVSCPNFCEYCGKYCCPSLKTQGMWSDIVVLNMFSINDNDILQAVRKIKANYVCGTDCIPAFLLVDCIHSLLPVLQYIFNLVLKTSTWYGKLPR